MIATPVFKRFYDVCVVDPEGVYLLSERWPVLLKGPVFCLLAPLLDAEYGSASYVPVDGDVELQVSVAPSGVVLRR